MHKLGIFAERPPGSTQLNLVFLFKPDYQAGQELAPIRPANLIVSFHTHDSILPVSLLSIPGIIGPLLKMTLVPDAELRKSALPVFFDLLDFEHRNRGHFKQVGPTD